MNRFSKLGLGLQQDQRKSKAVVKQFMLWFMVRISSNPQ